MCVPEKSLSETSKKEAVEMGRNEDGHAKGMTMSPG
jgi:hypothetical protein